MNVTCYAKFSVGLTMALTSQQKGVLRGILPALVITIGAFLGAVLWLPVALVADNVAARLVFALKFDIAVVLILAVTIGALARHRFFSPEDIDGGGLTIGSARAKSLQAILQNTLEQTVLAVMTHLVWAVVAPAMWMVQIPIAVVLFVVGRTLFWRGYQSGAPNRALGFGLTFYPSVLMAALSILLVFGVIPV